MVWWKHTIQHSKAAKQGWRDREKKIKRYYARKYGIVLKEDIKRFVNRSSPEEEKEDYHGVFKDFITKRRDQLMTEDVDRRYKKLRVPKDEITQGINIRYEKMKGVQPIEIKGKVVDFKPTSWGYGGQFNYPSRTITIDERLKNKTDWAIRKGTIAHEFQHSVNLMEDTPSVAHNLLRQTLLQNNPSATIIGTFPELQALAKRYNVKIKKRIMKQPNEETITVYYFDANGKTYQFAKDNLIVTDEELHQLSRAYSRPIKETSINGIKKRYITFRYANIFGN